MPDESKVSNNEIENKGGTFEVYENSEELEFDKKLEKFIYMDSTKDLLNIAFNTNTHCVLWGPGGHGKSEITEEFLRAKGIEPFVLTMGTGINTDRLFGGLDLQVFNESGRLEYLVENSFMNAEYVIFEELFDAPDFILEQLKDILSSRIFRNGTQHFNIKTKLIICNTNKQRSEFAKNTSLQALMERFPLELEVKWKDYNKVTYEKLLMTRLGHADQLLCYTLERFAKDGIKISPRIAIKAGQLIPEYGPECLRFIAEFNTNKDLLDTALAHFKSMHELDNTFKQLKELEDAFTAQHYSTITDAAGVKKFQDNNAKLAELVKKLGTLKVDDSMAAVKAEKEKYYKKLSENLQRDAQLIATIV